MIDEWADAVVAAERISLRTIKEFADLSDDVLGRIELAAVVHDLPEETVIFYEKTDPRYLHAVLEGHVALSSTALHNATVTEILGPGCLFVLAAVLGDKPYMVTARTLARSTIAQIDASWLRAEMKTELRLFEAMVAALSRHDRMLVYRLAELKLRSAGQRLGCYLLRLSKEQGSARKVRLPCTKSMLAAHLGMAPEHLSRAFVTLQGCGVVTQGPIVNLNDPFALASFAKPEEEFAG
jgi:CRP/FNR family transcriptional activator FtrB